MGSLPHISADSWSDWSTPGALPGRPPPPSSRPRKGKAAGRRRLGRGPPPSDCRPDAKRIENLSFRRTHGGKQGLTLDSNLDTITSILGSGTGQKGTSGVSVGKGLVSLESVSEEGLLFFLLSLSLELLIEKSQNEAAKSAAASRKGAFEIFPRSFAGHVQTCRGAKNVQC